MVVHLQCAAHAHTFATHPTQQVGDRAFERTSNARGTAHPSGPSPTPPAAPVSGDAGRHRADLTRSPISKPVTSVPTLSTMPATSRPGATGYAGRRALMQRRSPVVTPAATTRTRTCPRARTHTHTHTVHVWYMITGPTPGSTVGRPEPPGGGCTHPQRIARRLIARSLHLIPPPNARVAAVGGTPLCGAPPCACDRYIIAAAGRCAPG